MGLDGAEYGEEKGHDGDVGRSVSVTEDCVKHHEIKLLVERMD